MVHLLCCEWTAFSSDFVLSLSGLRGVMASPVFGGIICYFSFCSDLCHTDTLTHTHSHAAIVHSRGVVSVAIESPGQQVNKGDAARGMSGEERRLGGWRWGWRVTAGEGWWEMQCCWGSCWPWPLRGGQMGCEGHWPWGRRTKSRGGIKALRPLTLFKPGVINDKTHRHTERASWPLWARCWNSGPGSLVWSLSQHFWLMGDSFPTTYYGNNTARDEEHNPAAAPHGSLIPRSEWILNARYSFKWKEKTAFLPH